jgi:hypothetical protein
VRACPLMPGFHNRRFFGCNAAFGRRSDQWSLIVDLIQQVVSRNKSGVCLPRLRSVLAEPPETVRWSHSFLLRQFPEVSTKSLFAGLRRLANRPLAANDALWTSGFVRHPLKVDLMACCVNRERAPAKKCDRRRAARRLLSSADCQEAVRPLFFLLALRATGRLDHKAGKIGFPCWPST